MRTSEAISAYHADRLIDALGLWVADDAGNPRKARTVEEWRTFTEDEHKRAVAYTSVGPLFVSTVFLPVDHSLGFGGPPILWETMVFREDSSPLGVEVRDEYTERYTSLADARAGHARIVAALQAALPAPQ